MAKTKSKKQKRQLALKQVVHSKRKQEIRKEQEESFERQSEWERQRRENNPPPKPRSPFEAYFGALGGTQLIREIVNIPHLDSSSPLGLSEDEKRNIEKRS